jgi:2-polyprenyl-3-methyl-5-hydroxy-6-metoxy-1,4-benzoquinol methylase
MSNTLNLGKLSFYWRMTDQPNEPRNPVPDFVDFSFEFIEKYQLIIQTRNKKTWDYLETIYKENYNVGYLQEGHDLAESYGNDFLNFIKHSIARYNKDANRISEIGAGGCYILNKLKKEGYNVAAIDPSPIAIKKGKELNIEVIPDFYPSQNSIPKSDLITHYDVLEHVTDPEDFLRKHSNDLNAGGLILFAVPDCTSYINSGDISMILHEHLNYYDSESLQNVVEAAGFEALEIKKADYGGVLYCVAKLKSHNDWEPKSGTSKFTAFCDKYNNLKEKVTRYINEGTSNGNTLGCYIPLRALPYLSILGIKENIRFFDDNSGIHQQYFDGFAVPVENRNDLLMRPVSHVLILSAAFGDKIKNNILQQLPNANIKIASLKDLNEGSAY